MKYLLSLLIMLPLFGLAQRYIVIDPTFKSSLIKTDKVTTDQLESGFITIDALKVDSVLAFLESVAERMTKPKFNKFYSMKWKAGLTNIIVTMDRQAYGDKYNIILHTETGNNPEYEVPIITSWEANGDTRRNLRKFIDYVKSNK